LTLERLSGILIIKMPDESTGTAWTPAWAAQELLAVLPSLARLVAAEVRREADDETTMSQFRVLAHLAEGPTTLSHLARRRRVTLQAMGELAQGLVERGWIARAPHPHDRRQQILSLTEHGRRHYERANERAIQKIAPLLTRLQTGELEALQIALPALRRVLAGEDDSVTADAGQRTDRLREGSNGS
jgi:DNA-binding MarR family transcriptional regulator